jgi:hypothetical protein
VYNGLDRCPESATVNSKMHIATVVSPDKQLRRINRNENFTNLSMLEIAPDKEVVLRKRAHLSCGNGYPSFA